MQSRSRVNPERAGRGDLARAFDRAREELFPGGEFFHESERERLLAGDLLAGQQQLKRGPAADQPWQALRPAPAGHEAQRGPGMAEYRIGRG